MNFRFYYGFRIFFSLFGAVFIPWLVHDISLAFPLVLGVVAAALTDLDDSFSGRLRNLNITLLCFLIASFSVELLFPYPILMTLGLLISTFGFTLLGALGQRYATISFGALLIAAYTMLGYDLYPTVYKLPLLLLSGALWYNVITFIEYVVFPIRPVQENLANSFLQLGDYLNSKSAMFDPDEDADFELQTLNLVNKNQLLISKLNATRTSLFYRLKSDRGQRSTRQMLSYYFTAQDIHERASSSHGDYQLLSQLFKHSDILFRFQRLLNQQAQACYQISRSILTKQRYVHNVLFQRAFSALDASLLQLQANAQIDRLLLNSLMQLTDNLRAIDTQLANIDSKQQLSLKLQENAIVDDHLSGIYSIWTRIRQSVTLQSPLFRHAIRMGIVLSVDYLIIQLTQIQYGYWIVLTSLFVCQPNYTATKRQLRLRVLGTLVGIAIGIPLLYLVPSVEGQLLLMVVSGLCFFLFRHAHYAYATAFITILTLLAFHLQGEEGFIIAFPRIINTIIGCAVAWLAVSYIWPDWKFRVLSKMPEKLCDTNTKYFEAITAQYHYGRNNEVDYRLARRNAHTSDTELASMVSTFSREPHTNKIAVDQSFRLLILNHTLLGYISTLGAHRQKIVSEEILSILDKTGHLLQQQLQPQKITFPCLKTLQHQVNQSIENIPADEKHHILVLQQILLILAILPKVNAKLNSCQKIIS